MFYRLLSLLPLVAVADYRLTRFTGPSCAPAITQSTLVDNVAGTCISFPDGGSGKMSLSWGTCFNATMQQQSLFRSEDCTGPALWSFNTSYGSGLCEENEIVTCVTGPYTPPTSGLVLSLYPNQATCPATGQFSGQMWLNTPVDACTLSDGGSSQLVSCGAGGAGATIQGFTTTNCSGPVAASIHYPPCTPGNASTPLSVMSCFEPSASSTGTPSPTPSSSVTPAGTSSSSVTPAGTSSATSTGSATPSPAPPPADPPSPSVAGPVIGSLVAVAAAAGGGIYCYRRRARASRSFAGMTGEGDKGMGGTGEEEGAHV